MNAVRYTIGSFLSDAPWFFMATVPFWGNERFKKKFVFAVIFAYSLMNAVVSYYVSVSTIGEGSTAPYIEVALLFLLAAVCAVCYKVHITKLLYSSLLTLLFSMPISLLSSLILYFLPFVDPFTGTEEAAPSIETLPAYMVVVTVLTAVVIALTYRMFSGLLRRELTVASAKGALYLCATPAMYFTFYLYSISVPYFTFSYMIIAPLAGFLCAYLNLRMIQNMRDLNQYQSDIQIQEMKNEFLLENHQQLEKHFAQIAEMKHEVRHHMLAVRTYLNSNDYEKLDAYVKSIQDTFTETPEPVNCDNRIIQAVLGHAALKARDMGFEIAFEILPLPELSMPDADLVSLLTNLTDNALESCANMQGSKDRWIKIKLKTRPPYLCLEITNARCGELIVSDDSYLSTKDNPVQHGHGIAVVRRIVEKHNGLISFEHTDDAFSVKVALQVLEHSRPLVAVD